MGISVISSYRGGCNFETVGLSRALVSDYFPGMISRISGIGLIGIEKKIKDFKEEDKMKVYLEALGDLSEANPAFAGAIAMIKNGIEAQSKLKS